MSNKKRKALKGTGRGPKGQTAVVAAKDRSTGQVAARVIERTDKATLDGFVDTHAAPGPQLYTDDTSTYEQGLI